MELKEEQGSFSKKGLTWFKNTFKSVFLIFSCKMSRNILYNANRHLTYTCFLKNKKAIAFKDIYSLT